jgi:VCBS repeat-containing protein
LDCGIVKIKDSDLTNDGTIVALDHGRVVIDETVLLSEADGLIKAAHDGNIIIRDLESGSANWGTVEAVDGGRVKIINNDTRNFDDEGQESSHGSGGNHGTIEAIGYGSTVDIINIGGQLDNHRGGTVQALFGGSVSLVGDVINHKDAEIDAFGCNSLVAFCDGQVRNNGIIEAKFGGEVAFDDARVVNRANGLIIASDGGWINFEHADVRNEGGEYGGLIGASGECSTVTFCDSCIENDGKIKARDGGTISFHSSFVDNREGLIAAIGWAASIALMGTTVAGGSVQAGQHGVVELDCATICDSTIGTDHRGKIETVAGWGEESSTSTFDHVTITCDSHVEVGSDTALVLTHGTTMFGGVLAVDCSAVLDVESTAGATLDGTTVFNHGTIQIDEAIRPATLTLEGGATVCGGVLQINCLGTLDIESPSGARLDDVSVAVAAGGIIQVDEDNVGRATLHLGNGTSIQGGSLSIGPDGTVEIYNGLHGNGASLVDVDVINDGTITFETLNTGGGDQRQDPDLIIGGIVTLHGQGNLTLAGADDNIIAAAAGGKLINESHIVGAGNIGDGSDSLTLDNEACGVIDANQCGGQLIIDTGHRTIDDDGVLKATSGGELIVNSAINNVDGSIIADAHSTVDLEGAIFGGSATIAGGTLTLTAAYGVQIAFADDPPDQASTLVLKGTGLSYITDTICGFSSGDAIDFANLDFNTSGPSKTTFALFGDFLTVSDSLHGPFVAIGLDGDYSADNLVLSNDGHGGTEISFNSIPSITGVETSSVTSTSTPAPHDAAKVSGEVDGSISFQDADSGDTHTASFTPDHGGYVGVFEVDPPTETNDSGSLDWTFDFSKVLSSGQTLTQSYDVTIADEHGATATQQVSVSIGGPGNDNFVFKSGTGADTIVNFNPRHDTIELDHFANIQNMQELAAAITPDAHGNAVLELGHGDSIAIPGVSASFLQQHLQSLVHLHA